MHPTPIGKASRPHLAITQANNSRGGAQKFDGYPARTTSLSRQLPQPLTAASKRITIRARNIRSSADPCVAARHVTGRLLDLSHICWRTCVADLLADHKKAPKCPPSGDARHSSAN